MKVTLVRAQEGTACPECNLASVAVFHVQIDFANYASPLTGCALCLSQLGAALNNEARIINKVPR